MGRHEGDVYDLLRSQLEGFSESAQELPGINTDERIQVLVKQLIDSIRRVQYVFVIGKRDIGHRRIDPNDSSFDPIMGAVYMKRKGMIDEAFWLAFLSVNYGKNLRHGWKRVSDIYGCLGDGNIWTWGNVSQDVEGFKEWIKDNYNSIGGAFGNHRKYETIKPNSAKSPGLVVESYVNWVGAQNSHEDLIRSCIETVGDDPREMFAYLYKTMGQVISFGRTSKFDYLTLLAKLGLAKIEPGLTYMQNSTGPADGAKLLFYGSSSVSVRSSILEQHLVDLESTLSLSELGMQVLEDALCNWQKSPSRYKYFNG